jgi:methyl-accepting chemotaxis protein
VFKQGEHVDQPTFYVVMTAAAVVIVLSFIVQTALFMFIYSAIKKLTGIAASVQAKAEPLIAKTGPVIDQVQGTIATVKDSVERISEQTKEAFDKITVETRAVAAAVSTSSQEIARLAQHQAEQISQTLDYTNATMQRQVAELDSMLVRTQDRFEDTTREVQSTVLQPMRELSAMLVGLRRILESLFGRNRKPIDQAYQDEELFI